MENNKLQSLGEALPAEIKRVKETVIPAYEECGTSGAFPLFFIKDDLTDAENAVLSGDVIRMMAWYKALKKITLDNNKQGVSNEYI